MTFDHFNLCLENMFDYLVRLLRGSVGVVWLIRDLGIYISYGTRFCSGSGVGTKVKRGGGGEYYHDYENNGG